MQSIQLLSSSCTALARQCIADFEVNEAKLAENLARNPVLVTALNRKVGYARAAEIAKRAYAEGRDIMEVAVEMTDLDPAQLHELLDPANLV